MRKLVSHEDDVLTYELLRHWTQDGHEVAWMRLTNKQVPESASAYLMCECDFDEEDDVRDGKVVGKIRRNDPHACQAKQAVRDGVIRESRERFGEAWARMSVKDAVLDIKRRVDAREWLGQHDDGMIYTQEVAELLGGQKLTGCMTTNEVHDGVLAACGELYAEEKLDLNGRILADFVPGFRFPREMQAILRYVVEEPLGWPNGDAGEGWLCGFEGDVQGRLGFASGKAAFGTQWPHIDGNILADDALEPVASKLRQIAPLVPDGPMTAERMALLMIDAMGDAALGERLRTLESSHPEIIGMAFAEFIRGLFLLAFERVEMDRQMRTVQVPSAQTLTEMADWLDQVAANCRPKAKA